MASNPAFNRIEKDAKDGYAGFGGPGASAAQQSAAAQAATAGMSAQQLQDLYNQPAAGPVDTRRVPMDDVIMKTLALVAIVIEFAAAGWTVASNSETGGFDLWMGGLIGTLVLGLVLAFKKTLSVPLILLYELGIVLAGFLTSRSRAEVDEEDAAEQAAAEGADAAPTKRA